MAQIIPVQAVGNQTLQVTVNGQQVTLNITQTVYGLFMDILCGTMVNGGLTGQLCQNLNRIVRDLYLGFQGDFSWIDNEGSSDPFYTGLGSRFSLVYVAPSDLPANTG